MYWALQDALSVSQTMSRMGLLSRKAMHRKVSLTPCCILLFIFVSLYNARNQLVQAVACSQVMTFCYLFGPS